MPAPPPPYRVGETTPLIANNPPTHDTKPETKRRLLVLGVGVGIALIVAFIGSMIGGYRVGVNSYCNPSVREAFDHEWHMEMRHQDDLRRQWQFEKDVWQQERNQWQQEHRRQMEEKKKKEAIQRANVKFETPSPHKSCLSYGTREYSAKLLNVPDNLDAMEVCLEKEGSIHGVMKRPSYCRDNGKWLGVFGHWEIDFQEAACKPFWSGFQDKGCSNKGSRIRIYHARLEYSRPSDKENWEVMCSTTPADFLHLHFDGPSHCADWGGIFDVPDEDC